MINQDYIQQQLTQALRQYRHNSDNSPSLCDPDQGFVFAYDKENIDRMVTNVYPHVEEVHDLINWCEAHLKTLRQLADSAGSFDEASMAIARIKKFKEKI